MDWINDIIFAIAKEARVPPQHIRPIKYDITVDTVVVTCDVRGQGLLPIVMPDAIFSERSGVHTLH